MIPVPASTPASVAEVEVGVAGVVALMSLYGPLQAGRSDCRIVDTWLTSARFSTVVAAVAATARSVLETSVTEDREWVGGVLRDDAAGVYRISVGSACTGQNEVTFAVPVARGFELVAFWHTHGAPGSDRNWFSREDAELVSRTGKDFYLMTPTGALKVLKSGAVATRTKEAPGTSLLDADATARLSRDAVLARAPADSPSNAG